MKNCTKHFLERWTERIVGITTEKERNDYIAQNRNMIAEHANKTFEFAQFINKGQIGDNVTRNYHIKDDTVFVTNTTDDALITVYKVDLGYTEEINANVRRDLMKEIAKLRKSKEETDFQIDLEVEEKEFEITKADEEIKMLEEQLMNLKKQRQFMVDEVKHIRSKSLNAGLDLRRFTMMLVNSKDYKKDLTTMK